MSIITRFMSADDFFALTDIDRPCELIDGVLQIMSPAGREPGLIGSMILGDLSVFVRQRGLGETYLSETGFRISTDPDTVFCPDGSYVAQERLSNVPLDCGFLPFNCN